MAGFITDIVQSSLSGLVTGAATSIGGYAGSAVNGVGNLIESGGETIGNGITRGFQGVGESINGYGTAARNVTAPGSCITAKNPVAQEKPTSRSGHKKTALSSTSARKALPSTKPTRALPTPAKSKDTKTATETMSERSSTYVPPRRSYNPKLGARQALSSNTPATPKSRTIQSGKAVVAKESTPQKSKTRVSPQPAVESSSVTTPSLRVPPMQSPRSTAQAPKTGDMRGSKPSQKSESVVGGPRQAWAGYVPGFAEAKANPQVPRRAPMAVGNGNKNLGKAPPGKSGSVIGGSGPKFF